MTTIGLVRIDLVFQSAGGVTAPELNAAVDLPLSRRRGRAEDGSHGDEVWIPPTSLAGSLRAHFGDDAERWFGSAPPVAGSKNNGQPLEPSRGDCCIKANGVLAMPESREAGPASTLETVVTGHLRTCCVASGRAHGPARVVRSLNATVPSRRPLSMCRPRRDPLGRRPMPACLRCSPCVRH
jgi:hypothetical protein